MPYFRDIFDKELKINLDKISRSIIDINLLNIDKNDLLLLRDNLNKFSKINMDLDNKFKQVDDDIVIVNYHRNLSLKLLENLLVNFRKDTKNSILKKSLIDLLNTVLRVESDYKVSQFDYDESLSFKNEITTREYELSKMINKFEKIILSSLRKGDFKYFETQKTLDIKSKVNTMIKVITDNLMVVNEYISNLNSSDYLFSSYSINYKNLIFMLNSDNLMKNELNSIKTNRKLILDNFLLRLDSIKQEIIK